MIQGHDGNKINQFYAGSIVNLKTFRISEKRTVKVTPNTFYKISKISHLS